MEKNKEKLKRVIPIRFSESMIEDVKDCASSLGFNEQDTFRLLIGVGLNVFDKVGTDIPKLVSDKFLPKKQG